MSVLVIIEAQNNGVSKTAAEVVSYGVSVAAQMSSACHVGIVGDVSSEVLNGLGQSGDVTIHHQSGSSLDYQQIAKFSAALQSQLSATVVVLSHDGFGKGVAPRIAARLDAGLVSGAVELPDTSNGVSVKKAVFSGKAFAKVKVNTSISVITVLPNSVGVADKSGSAKVEQVNFDLGQSKVTVKEVKDNSGGHIPLPDADLVVSAGRGLKGPENWGMVEELAGLLNAATACSRPVADSGWRPHHEHVGQTGVAIGPNLYIAIGISGAIQHIAGVNRSKVIVVINTDPEAPFFKAADYGIVGDAFEVVPKLIAALK